MYQGRERERDGLWKGNQGRRFLAIRSLSFFLYNFVVSNVCIYPIPQRSARWGYIYENPVAHSFHVAKFVVAGGVFFFSLPASGMYGVYVPLSVR
ncbi:hypothetical protein PSV09DRAFT_2306760, partial [Bipolaris maydis]